MLRRFLLLILIVISLSACASRDTLFQTSTIHALINGVYDGELTFYDLALHGDFGLGTFNAIDGEMVALDGNFYQVKTDGRAYPVSDNQKTPFAVVTFFRTDKVITVSKARDLDSLKNSIDKGLETENIPYAVKIHGTFPYIKVRSVPKQTKPYPPLTEVVSGQSEFEYKNITGTIVGFRLPEYMKGVNAAGYHFHFIADDKIRGGHVLGIKTNEAVVELDSTSRVLISLPEGGEFYGTDLKGDRSKALDKVEK
ncbi:MAG: acetolactate decarboxylase [Thermodesulfobacteriota bacterium]